MRIQNRLASTLLRLTLVGVIAATSAFPQTASAVQIRSAVTPSWVSDLIAIPDVTTIELHFRAPTEPGDSPIFGYGYSLDDGNSWNFMPTSTLANGTIVGTVRGLTPGTGYSIQVAAWNASGRGISSGTMSGTKPAAVATPAAPTNLQWANDSESVLISYTPPSGTMTGAKTQIMTNGEWVDYARATGTNNVMAIAGLTTGTYYDVRIALINASGQGAWSAPVHVLRAGVPSAVRNVEVVYAPGASTASVTFAAPTNNGGDEIQRFDGGWRRVGTTSWNWTTQASASATSMIITPRDTLSTYEFAVRASNNVGPGPVVSAPSLTSASGESSLVLTWTTPEADVAITGYTLQYRVAGTSAWTDKAASTSPSTLTGLTGGVQYQARVATRTAAGVASYSPIVTGMPTSFPSAPRALTASLNAAKQLVLRWTAPELMGGSSLKSYQLSINGVTWTDVVTAGSDLSIVYGGALAPSMDFFIAAVNASGRGPAVSIRVSSQVLTLTKPSDLSISDKTYALPAKTATDLPLTYTASPTSICTVQQTTLTLVAAGDCTVVASQAGATVAGATVLPAQVSTVFTIDGPRIYPPSAPTGLQALKTAGDAQSFTLTWTAPSSNGGSAVTAYSVQYKLGDRWVFAFGVGNSTATSATIKVTNGVPTAFRVAATNAKGLSVYSTEATPIANKPSAPTNVKIASASGVAFTYTISWTAPTSDGGEAVTYTLQDFKSGFWSDFTWDGLTSGGVVTGLTPDSNNKVTIRICAGNSGGVTCSDQAVYDLSATATPSPSKSATATTKAITPVKVTPQSNLSLTAAAKTALGTFAKSVKAAGKQPLVTITAKSNKNAETILANVKAALKAGGYTSTVQKSVTVGKTVSVSVSAV